MTLNSKIQSNRYSAPTKEQIKDFYNSVYGGDLETLITMLDGGFPPNSLIGNERGQNAAQYALDDGGGDATWCAIEILLDRGIDINYRDKWNNSLLIYILDVLVSWDYSDEIEERELKNKFQVYSVIRLRKTFDKLMSMKPSLSIGNPNMQDTNNIFDFAMQGQFLHWFEEHLENMTEEDKELFKGYRLAALYE